MTHSIAVKVVSPEGEIFSGHARSVSCRSESGELGIQPGHSQLLSILVPGAVHIHAESGDVLLYVSGGLLEVQPHQVSIMADTVERPQDVNESAALEAKAAAEALLASRDQVIDYERAQLELNEALAKLRVLKMSREFV
ncbi:MAG: F0F1 ATP synthase subunit epsilon [Gammaproteobacteria bacterium]|nr:F0F1 ATP synthase subunit epsilon [Gammaproteobacteria bacterium]